MLEDMAIAAQAAARAVAEAAAAGSNDDEVASVMDFTGLSMDKIPTTTEG
jgi:hypothetical protein